MCTTTHTDMEDNSLALRIIHDIDTLFKNNSMKELLLNSRLSEMQEMQFTELVLTRKPKSSEVFAHRKWLLLRMKVKEKASALQEILKNEIKVCSRAVSQHSRNYNAWNHRIWAVQNFKDILPEILLQELHTTGDWIHLHISNYSGFQYREFLLDSLNCFRWNSSRTTSEHPNDVKSNTISESLHVEEHLGTIENVLSQELSILNDLMMRYPSHEALWCHRRYILSKIPSIINELASESSEPDRCLTEGDKSFKSCASVKWCSPESEQKFIEACLSRATPNSWEFELIKRYIKWLHDVLQWHVLIDQSI